MSLRAEVAVPAAVALFFGAALGLTVGWLVGSGGQLRPGPVAAPRGAAAPAPQGDPAARELQLREALVMHEGLVAEDPDNAKLRKTVGDYQAALGEYEPALSSFEAAERVLRERAGVEIELSELLFAKGLALAELDRYREGLAALDESASLRPNDVTSRLVQVFVHLRRIMPQPPPGFSRKQSVARAEELIDEILAIDADNPDARQLREAIDSVRRSIAATGAPAGSGAP